MPHLQECYDSLGNLTFERTGNSKTADFKFNNLNQLTGKIVDAKDNYAYTYDQRGNLVEEVFVKNNKVTSIGAYTFDATNRMILGTNTAGEASRYTFNGLGALVENEWIVENNAYGYHGFDFVPAPIIPSTVTTIVLEEDGRWVEGADLSEADNAYGFSDFDYAPTVETSIKKPEVVLKSFVIDYTSPVMSPLWESERGGNEYRYTYGLERLSVKIFGITNGVGDLVEPDETIKLHYHTDRLGTTTHLTDKFGRVSSWTHYDEWGQITHNAVLKMGKRYFDLVKSYTGHEYDSVLQQYYAKARMYDAGDKRFTAKDLLKGTIMEPMTLTPYLYVINNPLKYVDPLGLYYDTLFGSYKEMKISEALKTGDTASANIYRLGWSQEFQGWQDAEYKRSGIYYMFDPCFGDYSDTLKDMPIYPTNKNNNKVMVVLIQIRLHELGYTGKMNKPLGIDGVYGVEALFATNNFKFHNDILSADKFNIAYSIGGSIDYRGFIGSVTWQTLFSGGAIENLYAPNLGVRDEDALERELKILEAKLANASEAERYNALNSLIFESKSGPYPVSPQASNQYNYNQVRQQGDTYRFHNGQDLGAVIGTPIYSTYYATVVFEGHNGTAGNQITLEAFINNEVYRFIYMHMSERSSKSAGLHPGDNVIPGQKVGLVGGTGSSGLNTDYAPHLHLEVRAQDDTGQWSAINVYPFIPIDPSQN